MLIIVTNGIISLRIDGYFNNERYKKLNISLSFSCKTRDNSSELMKRINREIIIKFINKYLFVNKNK